MLEKGALLLPTGFERVVVPLKITKEAEWNSQLPVYIAQMGEEPRSFQADITRLHQMRQDCRGTPATLVGIDIIVQYYRQLDSLSRRLPLAEQPLNVSFIWHDAFDMDNYAKQCSMAFEKANILFNIGALFSQFEGTAEAVRAMQSAASVFSYIAENFLHPPLMDIRRGSLRFLSSLMLAQAQEIATGKAAQDGKSAATLSKLATSAVQLYTDVQSSLAGPDMAEMRNTLMNNNRGKDHDAYFLVHFKTEVWSALAEYYKGEVCYNESKIGESISRYKRSQEIIQAALKTCDSNDSSDVVKFAIKLAENLKLRIDSMGKENNFVYNQTVPEYESLGIIEGASLVRIVSANECLSIVPERPELFGNLVPLRIHEELSKYSEEKSKLLRYESSKVATADTELQATLSSFGFPTALEKVKGVNDHDTLPEELTNLRKKAQKLNFSASKNTIDQDLGDISQQIDESGGLLDKEIADYQKARIEYGSRFEQSPSHLGNSLLFERLAALQERYNTVLANFDLLLSSISETQRQDFESLCGPEDAIRSLLPRPPDGLMEEKKRLTDQVFRVLGELESCSRTRAKDLDTLKQSILEDDISLTLISGKISETSAIFHKELSKFDGPCQSIEDNIAKHAESLASFKTDWNRLQNAIFTINSARFDGKHVDRMNETYILHENLSMGLRYGFFT
jgi:hypothetical protein